LNPFRNALNWSLIDSFSRKSAYSLTKSWNIPNEERHG
jgi:hypothetical protein